MERSPARPKRSASQLDLTTSNHSPRRTLSSPGSAKRQKNNKGTHSVLSLAKQGWSSVAGLFSPTPVKTSGSQHAKPPIDVSSPKRLTFPPGSNEPQPSLKSKFQPTQPHTSRQSSSQTPLRSLISHTPARASTSAVQHHSLGQPSSRSLQPLTTPARFQPGPLSPIEISSRGKVSRVGGGDTSIESIDYPEADEYDLATQPRPTKQAGPRTKPSGYQKKTPMGKVKHKLQLGNRDFVDLDALATQANDLSLSTPENQTRGPRPFANDPVPPPDQPTTKQELEQRVSQVKGYLTPSALSARRVDLAAQFLISNRGHERAKIEQLFASFRREQATRPTEVNHLTYDKIKARQLEQEKELDARLGAKKRRAFPARLSAEEQDVVDSAMSNPKFNSSIFGGEVQSKDLRRLRAGTWLNDEVITFYSCMINERAKPVREGTKLPQEVESLQLLNAYSVSSFWYGKLSNEGWSKPLSRWTKKVPDVFGLDVLVVPINLGNSHWVCGAINFKQKRIEYYDSLGGHKPEVFPRLRAFLDGEHKFKKKAPMDFTGWEDYFDEDVPQQANGCDCGVFTCQFMESLTRDAGGFDFEQENMPYLRNKMVLEIAEQRLIVEPWA